MPHSIGKVFNAPYQYGRCYYWRKIAPQFLGEIPYRIILGIYCYCPFGIFFSKAADSFSQVSCLILTFDDDKGCILLYNFKSPMKKFSCVYSLGLYPLGLFKEAHGKHVSLTPADSGTCNHDKPFILEFFSEYFKSVKTIRYKRLCLLSYFALWASSANTKSTASASGEFILPANATVQAPDTFDAVIAAASMLFSILPVFLVLHQEACYESIPCAKGIYNLDRNNRLRSILSIFI